MMALCGLTHTSQASGFWQCQAFGRHLRLRSGSKTSGLLTVQQAAGARPCHCSESWSPKSRAPLHACAKPPLLRNDGRSRREGDPSPKIGGGGERPDVAHARRRLDVSVVERQQLQQQHGGGGGNGAAGSFPPPLRRPVSASSPPAGAALRGPAAARGPGPLLRRRRRRPGAAAPGRGEQGLGPAAAQPSPESPGLPQDPMCLMFSLIISLSLA